MSGEHALDLSRLDAVPADLHLVVDAAEELDAPVAERAHSVPGPVHASVRLARERVRHEARRRLVRPADVPACDSRAADAQLAGHSERNEPQLPVDDVCPRARQGRADRDCRSLRRGRSDLERTRPDGRLRRAVVVQDPAPSARLRQPLDELPRERLSAHDEPPSREHSGRVARIEQSPQMRGSDLEHVDRVLTHVRGEAFPVQCLRRRHEVKRPAAEQRGEDARVAQVGAQRGHGREARGAVVGRSEPVEDPGGVVDEVPVRDARTLRRAGRAGGVHDVDEVVEVVDAFGIGPSLLVEASVGVDDDDLVVELGQPVEHARLGEENMRTGLGDLVREPRGRVLEVQRQVRAAGLHHCEESDDRMRRALHAQRHGRVSPDSE